MSISLTTGNYKESNHIEPIEDLEIVSYDSVLNVIDPIAKINQTIKWDEETDIIKEKYVIKRQPVLSCEVAKIRDNVIGYTIVTKKESSNGRNFGNVSFLAVDSRFKSKGIGSKLFSSTVTKLKRLGIKKMKLQCKNSNNLFYVKCAEKNHLAYTVKEVDSIRDLDGDYWSKFTFQLPSE